jgi:hypothetical protein
MTSLSVRASSFSAPVAPFQMGKTFLGPTTLGKRKSHGIEPSHFCVHTWRQKRSESQPYVPRRWPGAVVDRSTTGSDPGRPTYVRVDRDVRRVLPGR